VRTILVGKFAGPPPVLSALPRMAGVLGAAAFVTVLWLWAERASHQAVITVADAISQSTSRITLPRVQIVARRDDLSMQ